MAHLIMGHRVSWYFGTKLAPNYFVKAHMDQQITDTAYRPCRAYCMALSECVGYLVLFGPSQVDLGGFWRRTNTPGTRSVSI